MKNWKILNQEIVKHEQYLIIGSFKTKLCNLIPVDFEIASRKRFSVTFGCTHRKIHSCFSSDRISPGISIIEHIHNQQISLMVVCLLVQLLLRPILYLIRNFKRPKSNWFIFWILVIPIFSFVFSFVYL